MFDKTARFYDVIYTSMKDYAAEAARVADIILDRKQSAASLLDVACGTGLHLAHLRSQFACEGIDLDEGMLEVAASRLPGVPLHHGNMIDFSLDRTFDAVTCLFSAIGYTRTLENMRAAISNMAAHLTPGGVLVVEPWISPEIYQPGLLHATFIDESDLKICRIDRTVREGDREAHVDMDYLIGTLDGVAHETERHTTGLFTTDEQLDAMRDAGLAAEEDAEGLWVGRSGTKRGVLIGIAPS